MDGQAFDRLAKSVAGTSRRSLLKGAFGVAVGGVAGLAGLSSTAAGGRTVGTICRKGGDCASGVCGPKDGTGRQRCICTTPADCPAPAEACTVATCNAGVCGTAYGGGSECACTVCPFGQILLSNGTCATPCTSAVPDGSCGNRCISTSDGSVWAIGGSGSGGCSGSNLGCAVGSACSGVVCEQVCGWAGECGTVICSQGDGKVLATGC